MTQPDARTGTRIEDRSGRRDGVERQVYGRLNCRRALRVMAAGGYVTHRVFLADEGAAIAAGYRPCAVCMPEASKIRKAR